MQAGPRLLRAAVFAAVCVALSATGHALAACATVPWWTLPTGFLGVFALVLPFAGRTRSLGAVAAALGTGQLALHVLFGLGGRLGADRPHGPGGATGDDALIRLAAELVCGAGPATLSAGEARRVVDLAGLRPPAPAAGGAHGAPVPPAELLPSLPMLLAHLLAALATGWLLRRGDLALARLVRLSAHSARTARETAAGAARLRPLRAALALVVAFRAGQLLDPAGPAAARHSRDEPVPPVPGETLQHLVIRRGPPARCVLAA
ncbi:hypothetical protein ABT354_07035 [Streptomyces sp. NPDC000594]|uniref:hypothetical protein n=1 Tax=Streptomyces sp. NPDC000594 TaxID=3154261 RepID=UPI0033240CE4